MRDASNLYGLTPQQILKYELRASWWASWVCIGWMQSVVGSYFAWKVRCKWSRFVAMCEIEGEVVDETPHRS